MTTALARRRRLSDVALTYGQHGITLLGPGALTAAGMIALARGLFPGMRPGTPATIVIFIQWQALCLTCAKWGMDQLAFAQLGEAPDRRLSLRRHVAQRAFPVAIIAAVLLARVFGLGSAVLLAVSALLDTVSTIQIAGLSAKRRFRAVSFANLLNYPAFFIVLFLTGEHRQVGLEQAAIAFAISSALRCAWVMHTIRSDVTRGSLELHASALLGAQQALNFALFRGDQLLLPLAASVLFASHMAAEGTSSYVFMARATELLSSILVAIAPLLLPPLYERLRGERAALRRAVWWLVPGALPAAAAICAIFAAFAPGTVSIALAAAFTASAAIALPANLVTYALLRQNRAYDLVRALVVGGVAGLAVLALAALRSAPALFALGPAVALATFVWVGRGPHREVA